MPPHAKTLNARLCRCACFSQVAVPGVQGSVLLFDGIESEDFAVGLLDFFFNELVLNVSGCLVTL